MAYSFDELKKVIQRDLETEMGRMFPSYHNAFPEEFLEKVVEDVYSASAWQDEGKYSRDDISLAIQRQVLKVIRGM